MHEFCKPPGTGIISVDINISEAVSSSTPWELKLNKSTGPTSRKLFALYQGTTLVVP